MRTRSFVQGVRVLRTTWTMSILWGCGSSRMGYSPGRGERGGLFLSGCVVSFLCSLGINVGSTVFGALGLDIFLRTPTVWGAWRGGIGSVK